MLLPGYLQRVADPVMDLYEVLNIWAIQEIARSISKNGDAITSNGARNIQLMESWGMPAERIAFAISQMTVISEEQTRRLIENALKQSVGADFKLFHESGLLVDKSADAYCQGQRFQRLVREWSDMTSGEMMDFCKTLPETGNNLFREACDQAFIQTRSGLITKDRAVVKAIDYCADRGLRYINYAEHRNLEIESAVRTAVTTGINRSAAANALEECYDAGIQYVVVTSHLGARVSTEDPIENHAGWQGKVYYVGDLMPGNKSLPGNATPEYPSLKEKTGYPDNPLGLGGYNCRHNFYPFIPGLSKNNMRQFDLAENEAVYEATQQQRAMERGMRRTRRRMEAQKAALDVCPDGSQKDALKVQYDHHRKIFAQQHQRYSAFSKEHGLAEQMERTYTAKQQALFKKLNM